MKNVVLLVLFGVLAVGLVGCGDTPPPPEASGAERGQDMGEARKAQIEAQRAREAAQAQESGN